ncbi:MAG: flagellar motor protein MotA [Alphaproteobacteria bacterium]|nr:flagellar motor protein MotA [Alphaproteobacteria bacterium]
MTTPRRYLIRMSLFMAAAVIVALMLIEQLMFAFTVSLFLNSVILSVMLFGVGYIFRQVLMLYPEVTWLEAYRGDHPMLSSVPRPKLLGPMVRMLAERQGRTTISAMSMRSILDGVSARLDESRDISRYMIGLLIFLGLLGTFWGLMGTIQKVGSVIGNLNITGTDVQALFEELKKALREPLDGMGTAFSASLFGLASSLVLGFLDLQAAQAQNRFYNEVEEWLSGSARLTGVSAMVEGGEQSVPAYIQALLETTADSLDNLQRTIARGESARSSSSQSMMSLSERLSTLTDQMRSEQNLMVQLAQNQLEMRPVLARLAEGTSGIDEGTRNHIRNMDVHLMRLLDDGAQGRTQMVQEIRSEIRLLARTIAALAEEGEAEPRR